MYLQHSVIRLQRGWKFDRWVVGRLDEAAAAASSGVRSLGLRLEAERGEGTGKGGKGRDLYSSVGAMDSPSGGLRERLLVDDDDDGAHENGSKMKRGAAAGPEGVEYLTVDEMLVKYVGEFGRAQFWHFVLVSLAWTVEALHTMSMIFGDRVPAWRCVDQGSSDGGGSCTPSSSLCDLAPGSWEWVDGKSASTVSQFNLICGEEYKVGLAGSLFFIGALFGKCPTLACMSRIFELDSPKSPLDELHFISLSVENL